MLISNEPHDEPVDVHFKLLELTLSDELIRIGVIVAVDFFLQRLENLKAVLQMLVTVLIGSSTHCLDVKADIAFLPVFVLYEDLDLVEGRTQILYTETLVLIIADAVLIIEVNGEQLIKSKSETDFIGRIQPGQDCMCALEIAANTFGINGRSGDTHHMADGAAEGAVNRFIWLGFNADADRFIIAEHVVDRFDQLFCSRYGALGFRAERTFAGKPQHNQITAQFPGNIDGTIGAPHGKIAVLFAGACKTAVSRMGIHPEPRRNKLGSQAVLVQHGFDFSCFRFDLFHTEIVHVGNSIVIMKLHSGKTQLGKFSEFGLQINRIAGFRAVGIRTGMDIPGPDGKFELGYNRSS